MGITHIVRGDDHISNTPKQIQIYKALNWDVPKFSHLPLILGEDKKRLSKRHGATSVEEFKESGILSDALFNYLCLLGWAPGDDREMIEKQELTKIFDLKRVSKGNAVFDPKKLLWMNAGYIANLSNRDIYDKIFSQFDISQHNKIISDNKNFLYLIEVLKPRVKTLNDFVNESEFYFFDPDVYEQKGVDKFFKKPGVAEQLKQLRNILSDKNMYSVERLEIIIRDYAAENELSAGKVIHPLRLALTGKTTSPGIFDVLFVLGRDTVINRLDKAIKYIDAQM
jgi:glutamyl-tRNA synthetase